MNAPTYFTGAMTEDQQKQAAALLRLAHDEIVERYMLAPGEPTEAQRELMSVAMTIRASGLMAESIRVRKATA